MMVCWFTDEKCGKSKPFILEWWCFLGICLSMFIQSSIHASTHQTLPSCLSNHIKMHYIDHYTPLKTVYHPLHQSHPFNHAIYPNLPPNKKKQPPHQDRVLVSRRIGKKNWTFEVIDDTSNLSTTAAIKKVRKNLSEKISSTWNILRVFLWFWRIFFFIDPPLFWHVVAFTTYDVLDS